jgi:hypothetical protein
MEQEYYIYTTEKDDRWDLIANKFYGNCYEIKYIIESNYHIPITPILDAGIELRIPVKENTSSNNLPIWK